MKPIWLPAVFMLLPLLVAAEEHAAHVHGSARLQVAVDGNTVTVLLDSPLDSLIGFEHAPGNAAEQAALDKMVAALNDPDKWFVLSAAADCKKSSVKLASLLLGDKQKTGEPEGHSDLDGEFVFICQAADKLVDLKVGLFDMSANLQHLDVEVVAPDGQKAGELNTGNRTIAW